MRIAIIPVLLVLPLLTLAQSKKKKPQATPLSSCASGRAQALRDYKGDSLKYYYYGIVGASKETIGAAKKLGVNAISSGCMVDESVECYNATADSLIYAAKKVHLSRLR